MTAKEEFGWIWWDEEGPRELSEEQKQRLARLETSIAKLTNSKTVILESPNE